MAEELASSAKFQGNDQLSSDLARAVEADQFFLVYQPTIDLHTNAFAGVEALIRWRHPKRGVVPPELFIAELERSGGIIDVGRWALLTACTQGAAWHDKGYRFSVSVNVSSRQFDVGRLVDDVADALTTSMFDPALLVLEFSQDTLATDPDTSTIRCGQLRELGVRLAVDDFIPGDSTLADIERCGIDVIKLDREFIARLTSSSDAESEVHDLVQLAKYRHLQIIASGIEDAGQRKLLQLEDVNIGQGYLFSRPHEAEEIDRFLEDFAIFSGKPL